MAKPEIQVRIDSVGARGDGIATVDDDRLFVPYTVAGDVVRVRLSRDRQKGIRARLAGIDEPGPGRTAPACRYFGECGGCALQHMDASTYGAWKLDLLITALSRQGVEMPQPAPLQISPPGSRRRADLTAIRRRNDVLLGLNERGSHRVLDLAECPVLSPDIVDLFEPLRPLLLHILDESAKADVIVTASESGIELVVVGPMELGMSRRERLVQFAEDHDLARIARGYPRQAGFETVIERRPVRMTFGGVPIGLPPAAFLQATAEGEAALVAAVVEAADGAEWVADLFAGAGTFTFPLAAKGASVRAVEGNRPLTRALQSAANAARLVKVMSEERDLDRRPLPPEDLNRCDVVIFDPPRSGARAQAERLAESDVERVIAVSCNPATFARDARILLDGEYHLRKLVPVDQFLWSPHLELVAVFDRDAG